MNADAKACRPLLLFISVAVLSLFFLSGCMAEKSRNRMAVGSQVNKSSLKQRKKSLDQSENQNQRPESIIKAEGSTQSKNIVKAEDVSQQALQKAGYGHNLQNESGKAEPEKIQPDRSWKHISRSPVLGLQTPVKKTASDTLDKENGIYLDLAFDNAELTEILDLVLFEHFNIRYMIDPSIKAKLTFHIDGTFSGTSIINRLNSVLHLNNIAIVQGVGSIFKIVRKNDSARAGAFKFNDLNALKNTGDITRLIKIKYLHAVDAAKKLKFFVSKNAQIVPDAVNNSVVVTDTRENIIKVASIIDAMDVPFFKDISWQIFPVYKAKAETIAVELVKLFKTNGLFKRPGVINGSFHIQPIKTINGILVVTRWPEILKTIGSWVNIMDQSDKDSSGVYVYYVENGDAVKLADILKQVYGGKISTQNSSGSQKIVQAKSGQKKQPEKKTISGDLTGDVKIIADETNNAIIFKANSEDYTKIKKILDKLDIMPRQVLLNVVVAEVTLENSSELGVQWMLNNSLGDYQAVTINDQINSFITTNTGLGSATGFAYGVFNAADALKALVRAVGRDSEINILSSPNIIGVDNKQAKIEVAEEVPTVTGTVTDANGGITNTVQYKKTGIILTATPSINSRGLVKLELTQEVSEKGTFDSVLNNYTILTRKATTSLVVEDKQTIFIGGLMRETTSLSDAGVPVLRDIPVLGYLFKKENKELKKTELVFLITPHVIKSRSQADLITKEFTSKISQVKELIDK